MNLKYLLLVSTIIFAESRIYATDSRQNGDDDDNERFKNEIGASLEPAYFLKEKSAFLGLHLHYVYNIPSTKFGLGLGYERIFDPNRHKTIGIECSYRLLEQLTLNLSPGLKYEGSRMYDTKFALHFETSYEFELKHFHLGPAFEIATDTEDYHFSAGLHFGFEF